MFIQHTDFNNINFSKYKRFFAFGCSFTRYHFATWADILSQEMPRAEFFNLATPGAGNTYIISTFDRADRRYKFCETDLVIIMWTSFNREDRFLRGVWKTYGENDQGNLMQEKDNDWYTNAYDPYGSSIRDLSLISLQTKMMQDVKYDVTTLWAFDVRSMIDRYKEESASFPGCDDITPEWDFLWNPDAVYDSRYPAHVFPLYKYLLDDGSEFTDYHPTPLCYHHYMNYLQFPLTVAGKYAADSDQYILNAIGNGLNLQSISVTELHEMNWPWLAGKFEKRTGTLWDIWDLEL